MAYIPTSIEQGIYAQVAKPFVLGTDSGFSLLVVMRKPTTANVANTTIASMGASGGSSGNTLLRLLTGTSPANLRLQLQNSANTNNFDFNTSGATINDQAWHTVLVSIDPTATTGSATVYIDGTAAGSATISGTVSATTFDYVTACCTIRGGLRIASAGGIFDIALVAPIHGYLDASAAASLRNPWQIFQPISKRIWVPGPVSSGTSVSLSGNSATASTGTLGPAVSIALSGLAVTAAAGTVTPSAGITVALTGAEAAAAAGSLGPEIAAALSGSAASASVGTVTPSAGTVVDLSGLATTASAGSVAPAVSVVLSGAAATVAVGEVSPQSGTVAALSGLAATASGGTLSAAVAVTLSGLSVTSAAGSLAVDGQAQPLAISRLHRQSVGPRRPASLSTARR